MPADDLNYEEDKRVESLYPDIAKSKYVSRLGASPRFINIYFTQ